MLKEIVISLLYLIAAFAAIYKARFFNTGRLMRHRLAAAFAAKVMAAAVMLWMYSYHYQDRQKADIFRFYDDALVAYGQLDTHPAYYFAVVTGLGNDDPAFRKAIDPMNNWRYSEGNKILSNNRFFIRILSAFLPLTGGSYGAMVLIFCFLSFTGLFWIFRFFYRRFHRGKLIFFILTFFTPSLLFWSSGILKEALMLFFSGLILNCMGMAINGRWPLLRAVGSVLALAALFYLKAFYAALLLLMLAGWLLSWYFKKQRSLVIYFILLFVVMSVLSESGRWMSPGFYGLLEQKQQLFVELAQSAGAARLTPPPIGHSSWALAKAAPVALVNSLFRPLPFEATKAVHWLMIGENLLIFTMLLILIRYPAERVHDKKTLWFSLLLALAYLLVIGLTTPVFGAISRYRIIPLLFLELSFFQLIDPRAYESLSALLSQRKKGV